MNPMYLTAERLTVAAFKPYGDVIAPSQAASCFPINEGSTTRFHDICRPDIEALDDGCVGISIFAGKAFEAPVALRLMERHPLASQAFMPLSGNPYLVIVASGDATPEPKQIRAFLATDGQGVNYHKGTWHHPLITLDVDAQFLVIDRIGTRQNYEEVVLTTPITVCLPTNP